MKREKNLRPSGRGARQFFDYSIHEINEVQEDESPAEEESAADVEAGVA